MNKRNLMIGLAIGMLVLSSLACEFGFSTASIKDAYLATDKSGTQKTTEFTQDQPFVLLFHRQTLLIPPR